MKPRDTCETDSLYKNDTDLSLRDILECQLCNRLLDTLTLAEREEHYDRHFREEPPGKLTNHTYTSHTHHRTHLHSVATSSSTKPLSTSGGSGSHPPSKSSKWRSKSKTSFFSGNKDHLDVFWYPSLSDPPPSNYTPGELVCFDPLTACAEQNDLRDDPSSEESSAEISRSRENAPCSIVL